MPAELIRRFPNGAVVYQKIVLNDVSLESLVDSAGSGNAELINLLVDDGKLIV